MGMAPKTILIVDDNELNLKLVKGLLTIAKYNTLTAPDAETGLELARRHRPDLILMDIQLPGMDGLSATRMIKSDNNLKQIPVVALTSYAMQGDDQKAKAAGCNGYMTKPIDTRTFTNSLLSYLSFDSCSEPPPQKEPRKYPIILVVDDEPKNLKLLAARLSKAPYRIETAASGPEALEKARNIFPDLIILDVMMPKMDGYEVTRRLKADLKLKEISIIMLTSLDSKENRTRGISCGAQDFLTKPVNIAELINRINSLLGRKK